MSKRALVHRRPFGSLDVWPAQLLASGILSRSILVVDLEVATINVILCMEDVGVPIFDPNCVARSCHNWSCDLVFYACSLDNEMMPAKLLASAIITLVVCFVCACGPDHESRTEPANM